jgi:hypothetical protein
MGPGFGVGPEGGPGFGVGPDGGPGLGVGVDIIQASQEEQVQSE